MSINKEDPKDGGSAFPVPPISEGDTSTYYPEEGMSLRDYFAAKAMQAILASGKDEDDILDFDAGSCAQMAYDYADAMLEARK